MIFNFRESHRHAPLQDPTLPRYKRHVVVVAKLKGADLGWPQMEQSTYKIRQNRHWAQQFKQDSERQHGESITLCPSNKVSYQYFSDFTCQNY
jgi:hypothetical protein